MPTIETFNDVNVSVRPLMINGSVISAHRERAEAIQGLRGIRLSSERKLAH